MAMSTEDIVAAREAKAAQASALAGNNGIEPALTAQFGITDPDLVKYLGMYSMPYATSEGGNRGQGGLSEKAAAKFASMGGQAELDRLQAKISADPILQSQLKAVTAAGNKSDIFSKIGDAVVEATPYALGALGAYYLAPLAAEGMSSAAAGSAGSMVAPGAAADTIAAMGGAGGGVTGAMETAGILSAAGAPGVAASTAAGNVATGLGYGSLGTAATGAVAAGLPAIASQVAPTVVGQGVQQLTTEQLASIANNPEVIAQYSQAGMISPEMLKTVGQTAGTSWMDYLSTGLGLVQGVQGVLGGNSQDANASQNAIDPFAPYRAQYAQQLNQLMSNPASVTSLPGYQFLQDQGMQTVQRGLSAQGKTVSGQEQLALQEQGQGLANKYLGDQYTRLAQLSGANASPGAGGTAYNQVNANNQAASQAGWSQLGTLAAGAAAPNNPINSAVTGAGNFLSNLWR